MSSLTLGLDLGTNSIGWALLEYDDAQHPKGVTACGVRIFQEAVEAKTKTPKNRARRDARSARKLVARRKQRRDALLALLIRQGLLPLEERERTKIFNDGRNCDAYTLRKRGLDEKLDLPQFGRVLFHINQRRGFKSNRKAQLADIAKDPEIIKLIQSEDNQEGKSREKNKDIEEGIIKMAIRHLRKAMAEAGARTLGEYLYSQAKKRVVHIPDRDMYEEEFDFLWQAQKRYYADVLSDELKAQVHSVIFHQRPLKTQKFLVGKCQFEHSRKRAAKALLESQRFRILQDINNLTVKNPETRSDRALNIEEREKLRTKLNQQGSMTWGKVRQLLNLHGGEKFNLEQGGKDKLVGNRTEIAMRKALSDKWDSFSAEEKRLLLVDLLTIDRKDAFIKRARSHWKFTAEQAYKLATTELEPGYVSLSLKAINNLLPFLEQGMNYHDACQAAGYQRGDQKPRGNVEKLGDPPNLRNPVVQKALHEARRVVNAIIRQYGKPSVIRVELARDMKLTKKQKDAANKQNNANKRLNEEAAQKLFEQKIIPSADPRLAARDDLLKYRLWKECGGLCPYTGQSIGMEMLFTNEVDIEHILPYCYSLDDSYMNKTLCMAQENRLVKRNRTPYQAYSGDADNFEKILQRISDGHMPLMSYTKRKRFEQKEINMDDFVNRQLSDTRYICLAVKDYLAQLGTRIEISKGEATATLRHRWGLNRILARESAHEKNRGDHRHHAIDAIVIALTSRALFKNLSDLSARSGVSLRERGFELTLPWPNFYSDVEKKIQVTIVSHAAARKITGAFHEDTVYGYSEHDKCFIYRKPLGDITTGEAKVIRDKKIKELVLARLAQHGGDTRAAFSYPLYHVDGKTPIRRVRLAVKFNPTTVHKIPSRGYLKYGNNHHVEIIENISNGERRGMFVTTMEAAKRARIEKTSIVCKSHGPEWNFIMSLGVNDMVEIEQDGKSNYYRLQLLDASNRNIIFRLHTSASIEDKKTRLQKKAHLLSCRKISIDPLGGITTCND